MKATMTQVLIEQLVRRASSVLDSPVAALDEAGQLIALSARGVGSPAATRFDEDEGVPFDLPHASGRLVVLAKDRTEPRLPRTVVKNVVDMLITELTMHEARVNQHEIKNQFIHRLLRGTFEDEEAMLHEGQILGMDLSRPRAVVLVDAGSYVHARRPAMLEDGGEDTIMQEWLQAQAIISCIVRFFRLPNDAICAYIGGGHIAVLKASSSRDLDLWAAGETSEELGSWSNLGALKRAANDLLVTLEHETGSPIAVGIGRYHPGINGLAHSYEDARAALSIGRRVCSPSRPYCLDELGMAALVGIADERTRRDLARHLLRPLEQEAQLIETLEAFFEANCSPLATSARLFIHRNTLNYRLDKIASLTGLDPKRFDDAMVLRFALILHQLAADSLCIRPTAPFHGPEVLAEAPMRPLQAHA